MTLPLSRDRAAPLTFIVESGTDVRMLHGLAEHFRIRILARRVIGGVEISHDPDVDLDIAIGPPGRARFAQYIARHLRASDGPILVQGHGPAALAANRIARRARRTAWMLICSPVEAYYRCRRLAADPRKPYRSHELLGLRLLARINARIGQGYVVLSDYLRGVVRGHGTKRPVHVVPVYGVDTESFRPAETDRPTLRRKLGLPESGKILFFSSRIAPEKDARTLLAAMSRLMESGHDVWLLHRSGGYDEFLREADRSGVRARVIAGPAVHPAKELPALYQASDVCVQASREEGLGFSVLESLACETPVVAAAVGGLRETIREGETGWLYPSGDAITLADRLLDCLGSPQEALRRARAGRAMVRREFESREVFARLAACVRGEAWGA